ncbi:MAG: DNA-directed RNA polymerase subunit omega [Bdellovibrionales bacterium]|nr:DNA-directed RNA polymerase subunit omega [Bdellovibrionales bacterium]
MARITVEDCLNSESNRFTLVRLAARRAKQLLSGSTPVTDTKGNRAIVSALREIADGKVRFRVAEQLPEEFTDPLLDDFDLEALSSSASSDSQAEGGARPEGEREAEAQV